MNIKHLAASLLLLSAPVAAHAWDIRDLLNKAGESLGNVNASEISDAVGGMVNGLFNKTNLEVKDLVGTWKVTGSAVSFRSDNFLQQAGGSAAAAIVESKLDPYYKQYGLTGATLAIDKKGTFTLTMQRFKLSGTVTKQDAKNGKDSQRGNFYFNFSKAGVSSLGKVDAYVSKNGNGMDVMFDASKLKAILSYMATFSKMQLAQTASDLLNSYDGICIGFKLTK